jgi:hypothetical protein
MKTHKPGKSKRICAPIVIAVLATGIGPVGAAALADDTGRNGIDLEAMSEDIEVMARILTKAVGANYQRITGQPAGLPRITIGDKDEDADDVTTQFLDARGNVDLALSHYALALGGTAPDLNIRGFYVPDSGVVFAMDIAVRTALATESEDEDAADDMWKMTEKEVRKGESYVPRPTKESRGRTVLDPQAVELAAETLVKAVAKHGSNMDQLHPGEAITLAVRFRASTAVPFQPDRWFFTAFKAARRRVVIQVPVETIHDFAAGRIDPEDVVSSCRVTKY